LDYFVYSLKLYVPPSASQLELVLKNPPANAGDLRGLGLIPGLGRPLVKDMEIHSNIFAWRIPWTGEPG